MLHCENVYGMIKTDGQATLNYHLLDPWVRVNVCLGNQAEARKAAKRLQEIGYRDTSFVQFTSTR
jgi:hypothetical protein